MGATHSKGKASSSGPTSQPDGAESADDRRDVGKAESDSNLPAPVEAVAGVAVDPKESSHSVPAELPTLTPNQSGELPGKKTVEVIKVFHPEDYEDDTNQTGQSHYEMRIQDSFFSAPSRVRSKAYTAAKEAENAKKQAKAERKAEKAAKKKSKSKKGADTPELVPNTVPWAIENTKKLGILNLSKMQLENVPDQIFESLPGTARIINISFNRITQLDTRICDYVLVQRLIANGNLLASIPQNIVRMTALKKLDLASNKLTSLPDAFRGMSVLEHVDLSDNMLSELPPSFSKLQLTALILSHNRFTEAPSQITSMEWLMALDMSHNQITGVPQSYMSLTQLTALNLEHNKISDFPDVVLQMCVELVTLRITDNPIRMQTLEAKASYADFAERRRVKLRRQLDAGTITEADLMPCDP